MGPCLSKKSAKGKNRDRNHDRDSTLSMSTTRTECTTNILHNKMGETIPMIVCNHPSCQQFSKSLFIAPPTEDLLSKFWIQKQGHLIRTWKKRYCVIEKNEVKYYGQPHTEPPYGKNLKGHITLAGAVCIAEESDDFSSINVEIFGSLGEKDLFFTVDNTEEGKEFVNNLQWAIRKATLASLIRKAKSTAAYKVRKATQGAGTDWLRHHEILYEESLKGIKYPQIYEFVVVNPDGSIVIRPGIMKLWTAFGDEYTPTLRTDSEHLGLAIHIWDSNDGSVLDLNADRDNYTVLTFADIVDVSYQYVEMSTTRLLKPTVGKFLHQKCSAGRYAVITIKSEFGMSYHILTCCLHGYDDAFMYLQNVLLYLQARKKLHDAGMGGEKKGRSKHRPPVVDAVAALNE